MVRIDDRVLFIHIGTTACIAVLCKQGGQPSLVITTVMKLNY
jgi:hypothetical protein